MDSVLFGETLDSLGSGVVLLDEHARITYLNNWFKRASGLWESGIVGSAFAELFPEWERGRLAHALTTALRHRQPVVLSQALNAAPLPLFSDDTARNEGRRMHQALRLVPIRLGETTYCCLQVSDVTAAVQREQRLREAAEEARAARHAQREFFARMSHEIRTPMNGVIALCELLLLGELSEDQREMLQTIGSSGKSLLTIINDILDYSKLDAGKMSIQKAPTDLPRLLQQVDAILRVRADEKAVRLGFDVAECVPEYLELDELRVRQILLNLVSNAVKFTPSDGSVRFDARYSGTEQAGTLRMEVSDTGIGIADVSKLFQDFAQADDSIAQRFGGTGLGLSICKHLVELMGGTIGVTSELGKGSVFWIELPSQAVAQVVPEPKPNAPARSRGGRVLVADDNAVNQLVARKVLTTLGYDVDVVDNGRLAVERVRNTHYDLVLMDCIMPEMDGFAATKAIREAGFVDLPIIAVTAAAQNGEREICIAKGMTDYLPKPLTLAAVTATLQRVVGESQ